MGVSDSSLANGTEIQKNRFQKLGITLNDWAEAQVRFWRRVYLEVSSEQALVHDTSNLAHVYQVVSSKPSSVESAKQEIRATLLKIYSLNSGRNSVDAARLTPKEQLMFEILGANEDPRAYQFAADRDRIRAQIGQRDRLENAFSISKRYLARMEEMFTEEGVPPELTRLPFVESGFVNNARSKVGATGIWQFMPKTGMKDLRITPSIDERYDPLKSTRAAARFLKSNHRILGSWPLAIMAYHHGPGLVQKAVQKLKTQDAIQIIQTFKNPSFQFASQNYLFEFLAMLDVNAMHELFFKDENATEKLPDYITVSFPVSLKLRSVVSHYKLSEYLVRVLNPHFLEPLWNGQAKIPAHYPVRIAGITLEDFRKLEYPKP
jgi:membrane-bound lytic murein transglycosylase D